MLGRLSFGISHNLIFRILVLICNLLLHVSSFATCAPLRFKLMLFLLCRTLPSMHGQKRCGQWTCPQHPHYSRIRASVEQDHVQVPSSALRVIILAIRARMFSSWHMLPIKAMLSMVNKQLTVFLTHPEPFTPPTRCILCLSSEDCQERGRR